MCGKCAAEPGHHTALPRPLTMWELKAWLQALGLWKVLCPRAYLCGSDGRRPLKLGAMVPTPVSAGPSGGLP